MAAGMPTRDMNIPDRCADRLLFRAARVRASSLIVMPSVALPFNARDDRRQVEYRSVRTRGSHRLLSMPRGIAIPCDVLGLTSRMAGIGIKRIKFGVALLNHQTKLLGILINRVEYVVR